MEEALGGEVKAWTWADRDLAPTAGAVERTAKLADFYGHFMNAAVGAPA
jgi:hypothetical protein